MYNSSFIGHRSRYLPETVAFHNSTSIQSNPSTHTHNTRMHKQRKIPIKTEGKNRPYQFISTSVFVPSPASTRPVSRNPTARNPEINFRISIINFSASLSPFLITSSENNAQPNQILTLRSFFFSFPGGKQWEEGRFSIARRLRQRAIRNVATAWGGKIRKDLFPGHLIWTPIFQCVRENTFYQIPFCSALSREERFYYVYCLPCLTLS